ncbi:hypothetical protein ACWGK5_25650 [Rhodococcus qingshengii]
MSTLTIILGAVALAAGLATGAILAVIVGSMCIGIGIATAALR